MDAPVRILTLLILAAGLASGHAAALLLGIALLLGAGVYVWRCQHGLDGHHLRSMFLRVRWLLLAILILYGWFTPGTAVMATLGALSPTLEGLLHGLMRAGALLAIVAAVYLLFATTPRGELIAGLLWFGRPLRRLGVDDRRFALRLVLTLEAVPQVQALIRTAMAKTVGQTSRLARIGHMATAVLQSTLAHADQASGKISVPAPRAVPLWQWLSPLALLAGFLTVTSLSA